MGNVADSSFIIPVGYDINTVTATYDGDTITNSSPGAWYEFTFSEPISCVANTTYAIVVRAVDGTVDTDIVHWRCDEGAATANGCGLRGGVGGDDGPDWEDPDSWNNANRLFTYKLYGTVTITGEYVFPGTMTCQNTEETAVPYFDADHIGTLYKLTFARTTTVSEGELETDGTICAAIDVKGTFTYNTHGRWAATITLQRNENNARWETVRTDVGDTDRNLQLTKVEEADNVQYRAVVSSYASGPIKADITLKDTMQSTIVRVTGITSTSVAVVGILSGDTITTATRRWAEGAWSLKRGYPQSVTFFEDRCIYGGMTDIPAQATY